MVATALLVDGQFLTSAATAPGNDCDASAALLIDCKDHAVAAAPPFDDGIPAADLGGRARDEQTVTALGRRHHSVLTAHGPGGHRLSVAALTARDHHIITALLQVLVPELAVAAAASPDGLVVAALLGDEVQRLPPAALTEGHDVVPVAARLPERVDTPPGAALGRRHGRNAPAAHLHTSRVVELPLGHNVCASASRTPRSQRTNMGHT